MEYLDYENIVSEFLRITGLKQEQFEQESLISSGTAAVMFMLKVSADELTEFQRGLCEYAAAAVAAYRFAAEKCLTERPVMSENGEVSLSPCDIKAVQAAREVRERALRLLCTAGIADYGDFSFEAV